MHRLFGKTLFAGLLALLAVQIGPAAAAERIALVIGNSEYERVGRLENSGRDAALIARTLEEVGFDVTLVREAGRADITRAIAAFGRQLREAGPTATGLFYYAGHGVQSFGTNYLLPVDVALEDAADLPLVAVEAETVLRQMYTARNGTNIVILDACRDNPFVRVSSFTDSGLAEMKAPVGTFLAYATSPGSVAYDGAGQNSPFTTALARAMRIPGLPIEQAFKRVRIEVLEATDKRQTPWDTSSLTSDFRFTPSASSPGADELWALVSRTRDPEQVRLFLNAYPAGTHAEAARALLAELEAAAAPKEVTVGEQALIERATTEGTVEAYEAYLDAHPSGVFADLARLEIAALRKGTSTDPVGTGVTPEPAAAPPADPIPADAAITFLSPIGAPDSPIHGRALADLIKASPAFAPIEGLPENLWKDQTCAACHQWDQARLCEQARTYTTRGVEGLERIQHPFGGRFKKALADWASAGCP